MSTSTSGHGSDGEGHGGHGADRADGGDRPLEVADGADRVPEVATASFQEEPSAKAPAAVLALMDRIEGDASLDRAAPRLDAIAGAVVCSPRVGDALRGTWLGHALHPLLTDFPLGAWASASFLDLFGGPEARRPAQRLVGFGLLVSAPTAAAGLAEWQSTGGRRTRRVAVVHAVVNTGATVLYGSSWVARRRGLHKLAVSLGVGGGLVATLGGYFGGHLTLVRKIGTTDSAFGTDVEEATAVRA